MIQASSETWDEVARHYIHEVAPAERDLAQDIARLLDGAGVKPPARLIEIGAGSGHLSLLLQQRGYETSLLDFSPVALEHARAMYTKLGQEGGREEGRFILGDAFALHNMGIGDFDLAWNSGVCEHFDAARLDRMLRGMASVARNVLVVVPNPESLFYVAGRRRQIEHCTWNVGVELLRLNYEDIFHAAGLGNVQRGFIGREWTRAWIRHAVDAKAADLFEQLLSEGQIPLRELYLRYYIANSEPGGAMHSDQTTQPTRRHIEMEGTPPISPQAMDADAFDRTLSLDALGNAMLALSKMREEVDRLKVETFAATEAGAEAKAETATLSRALQEERGRAQAAAAEATTLAHLLEDERTRIATLEQSLAEARDKMREEVDRLKVETFAATEAGAAAKAETAALSRALQEERGRAQAAAAEATTLAHLLEDERTRIATLEQSLAGARHKVSGPVIAAMAPGAGNRYSIDIGIAPLSITHQLAHAEAARVEAEQRLGEAAHHILEMTRICDELLVRAEAADAERDWLLTSTSWRITRPLRQAVTQIRRLRR